MLARNPHAGRGGPGAGDWGGRGPAREGKFALAARRRRRKWKSPLAARKTARERGFGVAAGSALVLAASRGAAAGLLVQDHLADADVGRGDLDALVLAAELQGLLEGQLAR